MLFEPLTFRSGAVMRNRIALAALTNLQSLPDGRLGEDELAWLGRRADGGFGLVSTCATYVARDGKAWDDQLGIDRDDQLPGLARLADRIRRTGALASVQLFHGGVRAVSRLTGEQPWSASTWEEMGASFEVPRPATERDLARVIGQFVAAAERAQRAGFDGVELHGAHGYLLSQFLSTTMNPRTDGWGSDLAGRARLIREITRAVRARTGARFTIGVRLSLEDFGHARGMDLDDSLTVAGWLAADGAEYIHPRYDAAAMTRSARPASGGVVRAACPPRSRVRGGSVDRTPMRAPCTKRASVIAIGRAAIVHPDWPREARDPSWQPAPPPVTRAELLDRAVSPVFAEYLTRFRNFVAT